MTKQEAKEAFFKEGNDFLKAHQVENLWNLAEIYFTKTKPKKHELEPEVYTQLFLKLQDVLYTETKKKNILGFGDVYYLPTEKELKEYLGRFWQNYPKYTDIAKISSILCGFVRKCAKNNKFSPSVKYFIYKKGTGSQLAPAYENYEEEVKNVVEKVKLNNSEISL